MAISNYDSGFPNGVTLRGLPLIDMQNSAGQVFWVDSKYYMSGDANKGTFSHPLKTLNAALAKCRPGQGDKIFIAAGHSEEIDGTNNVSVNVSGVQIIGLGNKDNRPQFTFTTAGTASFDIDAPNVYIGNVRFTSNVPFFLPTPQDSMVSIWAQNSYFENVVFEGTSEDNGCFNFISIPKDGADSVADNTTISFCEFYSNTFTEKMHSAVYIGAKNRFLKIHSSTINGKFVWACVYNKFSYALAYFEDFQISGENVFINNLSGTSTRVLIFDNDKNGYISRESRFMSLDSDAPTSTVVGRSARNINGDTQVFMIDVSNANITTAGFPITTEVNGSFAIEMVSMETAWIAVETATAINIEKDGGVSVAGNPVLLSVPIAKLGAFQTMDLDDPAVLEANKGQVVTGDKFIIKAIGANATGGDIRVTVTLKAISDSSSVGEV
jgi:hypothetical protein